MFSQNVYKFFLIVNIDIQKLVSQCSRKQKIVGLGSQIITDDWYHPVYFGIPDRGPVLNRTLTNSISFRISTNYFCIVR